jgi:outer membrane protein OmpA-like peptidoglycan-associated protein
VADRAQQVAIPAPVAELLAAWNDRSADRFVAILAPDARVAVPPLHLELAGRDDVWLGVARVFGAFGALRYVSRHRYLTPESVTDEAILEGLQTQEFLGAPPPGRPGAVAARVIIRHDGAVVTNLEVWPDVAALRELFDGVARRIDLRSAGAAGPVVAALRATIPSPEGKLSVGQQRQERQERPQPASFEEALVGGPADPSGAGGRGGRPGGREPGHANHQPGQQPGHHGSGQEPGKAKPKAEVPKAPLPRRVRMVRALLAGAVMLVVAGLLVTYVVVGVRNKQEPVAASKPRPSASATHSKKPTPAPSPRASQSANNPVLNTATNRYTFSNTVLFENDKYDLRPEAKAGLDTIIRALLGEKRYGQVDVYGYTDSSGTTGHNLELSQARAQAVVDYFKTHLRDPRFVFVPQGQGEVDFVASNATATGREKNRRVEIEVPKKPRS